MTRLPQATAREFAVSIAAVADYGPRDREEPELTPAGAVQVLTRASAGGLEAEHVYVVGLHAGIGAPAPEVIPDALLTESLPADDDARRATMLGQELYVAASRARRRLVLAYPQGDDRGAELTPAPGLEDARRAVHAAWADKQEDLFGPAEALASTYRLLRDELMTGTARAGGRLAELRFDTDLDVTHAVVRYLELLKLAALMARPDGQSVAESLHDVNARILQAVTADQREIFETSSLDEYLFVSERDARTRAAAVAARDEPTLEPFLPLRGDGVVLSASDIDTYRTCPLSTSSRACSGSRRSPRSTSGSGSSSIRCSSATTPIRRTSPPAGCPICSGCSTPAGAAAASAGPSRAPAAREGDDRADPVSRAFRHRTGDAGVVRAAVPVQARAPHAARPRRPGGPSARRRVRADRLQDRASKNAAQLSDDVQLSLYAVGARESWRLDASRQAYYYLLDDQKVAVPDDAERDEWVREVATEVAEGIRAQGFEPTPSYGACSICDYRLACPAAER